MDTNPLISFEIKNSMIIEEEKRLNASSFSPDAVKSIDIIERIRLNGFKVGKIGDLTKEIFYPPRFKRNYVKKGKQFLSSKDIFDFIPMGKKIVNISDNYLIEKGWTLITRSGTVGRVLFASGVITNAAISEHVIRIVPDDNGHSEYIYAYMSSKIGSPLITKNIFGGVVDQIEPHHIVNIPIPIIPELEEQIINKITEAHELKEKAQKSFLDAENVLYKELNLPNLQKELLKYFGGDKGKLIKSFEVTSNELELRLDAPYHEPIVQKVKQNLNNSEIPVFKLSELVKAISIPNRFKRPYVRDGDDGVPFLSGSNLSEFKPLDLKYLYEYYDKIDSYRIHANTLLITSRGTVGRPYYVTESVDWFTASDNIIRIIPNFDKVLPSYLAAYFLTPYAHYQIQAHKAGSVQDLLQPVHLEAILIPVPDINVQQKVGNLILDAYNLRDKSNTIEAEAIQLLEKTMFEIANSNKV